MLNGKHVSMVAAMAKNRVIGANNGIPWHVPGEQKRFRQLTEGQLIVMGRLTYESIGRPLPNRDTLVITGRSIEAERVATCDSISDAIEVIGRDPRSGVFVAGGEQIYRIFLPYADTIYLTTVDVEPEGDAIFPPLPDTFECIEAVKVGGPIKFTLLTYRAKAESNSQLSSG
ncbi:dihydrofolate reductase [Paraburkholderia tropica]|uniref:dihydrofolate reductase n=1 Tax=Paraburkholderia tropica TaxID=92647 RepID=UPI001F42C7E0|nr:dihydrofolate reductase [Paraburkholderia tropica]